MIPWFQPMLSLAEIDNLMVAKEPSKEELSSQKTDPADNNTAEEKPPSNSPLGHISSDSLDESVVDKK